MSRDITARDAALRFKGTERYQQAIADSHFSDASTVGAFDCAFGTEISREKTPKLYNLLTAMRVDVRASAYPVKRKYMRAQPYAAYHTAVCSPADEELLKGEGSYPSARAAVGWAYALVLADLNPSKSDAILQRGRDFAQSRVVCDAAWQSDVDAALSLGTEDVLRLKKKAAFQADLEAARAEVSEQLRLGTSRLTGCVKEAVALAAR